MGMFSLRIQIISSDYSKKKKKKKKKKKFNKINKKKKKKKKKKKSHSCCNLWVSFTDIMPRPSKLDKGSSSLMV